MLGHLTVHLRQEISSRFTGMGGDMAIPFRSVTRYLLCYVATNVAEVGLRLSGSQFKVFSRILEWLQSSWF